LEGTVGKLLLERIFWGKKQLLAVIVWRWGKVKKWEI
jgi:hypothetical protein